MNTFISTTLSNKYSVGVSLLAGHNSSGVSLLKLLLKEEPENKRGINSSGIWMVEQQKDGTYQLKIYNSEVLGE
ncbi:MAG: hypothetical protein QNK35_07980 [Bacteroides sp.]|nr:hypothetical protein [Bacteroides sp.]